jgi:V/A-type H+/Na+-transporting ATPase subunit D
MPRMELPPTKTSLRRIKEDLSFAYEGFDLLNQKREILVMEIIKRAAVLKEGRATLGAGLEELYVSYRMAATEMGSDVITMKSRSERPRYHLRVERIKLMGLSLPELRLHAKKMKKCSGFAGTTARYDIAKKQCLAVLPVLADYAAASKSLVLLARELKKVQRRVNALEKIFIPRHEEAKKYIAERLEEIEREEIFVKKLIRQKLAAEI